MISRSKPVVMVAMSGGVDSSVTAALLCEQGYEVIGATLKLWCYEKGEPAKRACCSADAIRDARSVAVNLGFSHYVLDYSDLFRSRVVEPFVEAYLEGRTPYPCAACNSDLKFGRLFDQARASGAEFLATGHYVRRGEAATGGGGEEAAILRARDGDKDQSYALWSVSREVLPYLLFPLGELTKDEVRGHAVRLGFSHLAEKAESQDLCFVGGPGRYAEYMSEQVGSERVDRAGPMIDLSGETVGRHRGLAHYTVGQRRGLGVSAPEPLYVVALEPETNTIRVGGRTALLERVAVTGPLNWLSGEPPRAGQRLEAQIRYRHTAAPATIYPRADDIAGDIGEGVGEGEEFDPRGGARIVFDSSQRAITPGQSAVFYDRDRLLGGGSIERNPART